MESDFLNENADETTLDSHDGHSHLIEDAASMEASHHINTTSHARNHEMHQSGKGWRWRLDSGVHIDVNADNGLTTTRLW